MAEMGLSGRPPEGERRDESDRGLKRREDRRRQEDQERRSQARGLLLLALLVLLFALLRAGLPRVFTTGWWRLW